MKINDVIFWYRRENKILSSEFAKTHGISRSTLWRIENGKSTQLPISLVLFLIRLERTRIYENPKLPVIEV